MVGYALRRALLALGLVWTVSFVAFVGFGSSFDPLYEFNLCGEHCRAQKEELAAQFHLRAPILERYWLWLSGLVHHGFGDRVLPSFRSPNTAIDPDVFRALGVSAQLLAVALFLTVVFSALIGVASARRPGTLADVLLRLLAYVSWSMPTFLIGVVLWRLLSGTGWFFLGSPGGGPTHWLRTMALPSVALSLGLIGVYSRYIRTATMTELHQPYAVVARAKGLSETRVAYRHALRNALVPVVGVLALDITAIVGASLAADYVFQMGGLASLFVNSLSQADPFALTAIVVVVGAVVAVFTFLSDLALGWLDPRLRVEGSA
jgi:peptide/nickel transport system permease protein